MKRKTLYVTGGGSLLTLLAIVLLLPGVSYTYTGDTKCGEDCYAFINITSSKYDICFNPSESPVFFDTAGIKWDLAILRNSTWKTIEFTNDCLLRGKSQLRLHAKKGFDKTVKWSFLAKKGLAGISIDPLFEAFNSTDPIPNTILLNDWLIQTVDKNGNSNPSATYYAGSPMYFNVTNMAKGKREVQFGITSRSLVVIQTVSLLEEIIITEDAPEQICFEKTRKVSNSSGSFVEKTQECTTKEKKEVIKKKKFIPSTSTVFLPKTTKLVEVRYISPMQSAPKVDFYVEEAGVRTTLDPVLNSSFNYFQTITYNNSINSSTPAAAINNIPIPLSLNDTVVLVSGNKLQANCSDATFSYGGGNNSVLSCDEVGNTCQNNWDTKYVKWCLLTTEPVGNNTLQVDYGNTAASNNTLTGSAVWSNNATLIWLFGENGSVSATSIRDASGDSNHGYVRNVSSVGMKYDPCLFGACWNMTGSSSDNGLCAADSAGLDATNGALTFEAWVTHNASGGANQRIVEKWLNNGWGLVLRNADTSGTIKAWTDDGTEVIILSNVITTEGLDNESWHHLMFTFQTVGTGTQIIGYFDGKRRGNATAATTITATTMALNIGNTGEQASCTTNPFPDTPWNGAWGHVAIWDKVRDADYAASRYQQGITINNGAEQSSITPASPNITLNTPLNNTQYNNTDTAEFNYTVIGSTATYTCSLYTNITFRVTNTTNNNTLTSVRLGGFSLGRYNWSTNCSDTNSPVLTNFSAARYFYYNDTEAPNITLGSPANDSVLSETHNATLNWTATDAFSTSFPCTIRINGANNATNTTTNNTATFNEITGLSFARHNWTINCTDNTGNARTSGTNFFNLTGTIRAVISFSTGIAGLFFNPNLATANYTLIRNASGVVTGITNITSQNNSAQNQTISVGVYNLSTYNLTAQNANITFNLTGRAGGPADLKCSNSSSVSTATNITSASSVISRLAQNTTGFIWCWMDYWNATTQFNFTLNTGQE